MRVGDLVQVNAWDRLRGHVGLIVGREKFYINKSQPWRYTVLIGESGEILMLHENALEKLK